MHSFWRAPVLTVNSTVCEPLDITQWIWCAYFQGSETVYLLPLCCWEGEDFINQAPRSTSINFIYECIIVSRLFVPNRVLFKEILTHYNWGINWRGVNRTMYNGRNIRMADNHVIRPEGYPISLRNLATPQKIIEGCNLFMLNQLQSMMQLWAFPPLFGVNQGSKGFIRITSVRDKLPLWLSSPSRWSDWYGTVLASYVKWIALLTINLSFRHLGCWPASNNSK